MARRNETNEFDALVKMNPRRGEDVEPEADSASLEQVDSQSTPEDVSAMAVANTAMTVVRQPARIVVPVDNHVIGFGAQIDYEKLDRLRAYVNDSRIAIPVSLIGVRIPTEFDEYMEDYIKAHNKAEFSERRHLSKKDVITEAVMLFIAMYPPLPERKKVNF